MHGVGMCGGPAPFGPEDIAARRPRKTCEAIGCIDLFMEVWTHAHTAMHARFRDLEDVIPGAAVAYLIASARSQVAELNRQERVARGGVAKPQRKDGTIGRIANCYNDPWLADVFRFLLGYAASVGSQSDGWPLDVLTQRKNAWDVGNRVVGSAAARAELRADIENCLAVVRREAGDGWLYDCVLLPLANRAGRATLPNDGVGTPPWADADDAELDSAATIMLEDMLRRTQVGVGPGAALRAAVEAWLGHDPCPPEWARTRADDLAVQRLAKRLIADLSWNMEAA
jgi:hypothetical protein